MGDNAARPKLINRWIMVGAALVVQVCLGSIYAWSVFRPVLQEEYGWDQKITGYPYMASLFFFAAATVVAGRIQDRIGPRKVAIAGGLVLGVGAILSGVVGDSFGALVMTYGVLGGLGVGTAYVTPIATCVKWFPDMRGTITGLAVFGFGAGTVVFGPVINGLLNSVGISTTFYILGAVFIIAVCSAGSLFRVPPPGYKPEGWNPPEVSTKVTRIDWKPSETIRSPVFWLLWVIYFFGAGSGLMIIGKASPIGIEVAEISKGVAALGISVMGIFNAVGRLAWGAVSDRLGRLRTIMVMCVVYVVALAVILAQAGSFGMWLAGICLVAFCFGGFLAVMPSVSADFFGTKNMGMNYGMLFMAFGLGGVGFPFLIDYIKSFTGSFTWAMYIAAALCALGLVLTFMVKPPRHKSA